MKHHWYTYIIVSLSIIVITLMIMNEVSVTEASNLCEEVGGTPDVKKDLFNIKWSVNCDRQ